TVLCGELDNGQWLNRVDTEVDQVVDPIQHIEELRPRRGTTVLTLGVHGVEGADMQLIDDQGMKGRWLEALIVPRIALRIADDTVTVRESRPKLAGVWIAFQARAARTDNEKAVPVPILHAWDEATPVAVRIFDEDVRIVGGPVSPGIESEVHL